MATQLMWKATATRIINLKSGIFYKAIGEHDSDCIIFIGINGLHYKLTEIMHDGRDGIFSSGHRNIGLVMIKYYDLVDEIYGRTITEMTLGDFANLLYLGVLI